MRFYRGLFAVFVLIFLVSGISLLILIIDDKKDLSSRANFTDKNLVVNQNIPTSVPEAGMYNPDWQSVEPGIYLNAKTGQTVRILDNTANSASLSALLGSNFKNPKKIEQASLGRLTVEKFTYSFFGAEKKVNLWQFDQYKILEVGNTDSQQTTVDFLNQLVDQNKLKKVLGASTPDNWAKTATLTRPSIVTVFNQYCTDLTFFSLESFPLSNKSYPLCLVTMGTGFFINEDGLVATNGHIVKNLPKSVIYLALTSGKLDGLLSDFLEVYLAQSTGTKVTHAQAEQIVAESKTNKDSLYQLGGMVVDLNQKNILKFNNSKNDYFIQLNNTPAKITEQGVTATETVVPSSLVDVDYEEAQEDTGFTSSDVALLKINSGGSFPALPLGNIDDAVVGSELQVVGFPIAASSANLLLDTSTSEPTFTKGLVSAIKEARGNQKKLIQTDAIINHGNSGGPAILSNGSVVGIATYGVVAQDGSGSYNFLRDIQDLKDLMQKNNISIDNSNLYKDWQTALDEYYLGYYKYSSAKFQTIKNAYPQHPTVDKYLQDSESKINTVDDQTPKITLATRRLLLKISSISLLLSFIGLSFSLFLLKKQNQQPAESQTSFMV